MSELPAGTVTFLFSDIEGSTRLLQRLGPRYASVLAEHQALLRAVWAAHDGHEVDTEGDAFFVAFARAPDAVAAAAEVTRALAEHAWPEVDGVSTAVRVRLGLHTGSPLLAGDRYVGLDVHRAARIAAAGHGGQVLLSNTTRALVESDLPPGCTLRDLGAFRLKDLQRPEHISQLVLPSLPAEFPPLKTLDTHANNLPVQPTPLVDRRHETEALRGLLTREDVRLVTITGPGGVGKTRLGLQTAAELSDAFPDGIWYVQLAPLTDPALVVSTIAATLSVSEAPGVPLFATLLEILREKTLLLLLDNFEQVVDASPRVADILTQCPHVKVLVTSRVSLHLSGEHEYAVPPLAMPEPHQSYPPERLSQYGAVALFIQRARAVQPDFQVTNATAPAVAEICARLDGMPLAIELAAARVRLLPPLALLKRLERQLAVLTGGPRDLPERQQTMRHAIAWSYDLLSAEEQRLFRRLAVFAGGCTVEAAEAICAAPHGGDAPAPDVPDVDVLEGLGSLVDKSLLWQREEAPEEGSEPRISMLHVMREFALERLDASGEGEALRRAHAGYYAAFAEEAVLKLRGQEANVWIKRLEREHDNLRAALAWARERDVTAGLQLAATLYLFWFRRGYLREGVEWLESLLKLAPGTSGAIPDEVRMNALATVAVLTYWQHDFARSVPAAEETAILARAVGDTVALVAALNTLGNIASGQNDYPAAAARFEEVLALGRERNEPDIMALALGNLGEVAFYSGDIAQAKSRYTEALALYQQANDRSGIAVSHLGLCDVACREGDVAQAVASLRLVLPLLREIGNLRLLAEGLESAAIVAAVQEQGVKAARLFGAMAALRQIIGVPEADHQARAVARIIAPARAALGADAWAAAYAAGGALTVEEAMNEALASCHPGPQG